VFYDFCFRFVGIEVLKKKEAGISVGAIKNSKNA